MRGGAFQRSKRENFSEAEKGQNESLRKPWLLSPWRKNGGEQGGHSVGDVNTRRNLALGTDKAQVVQNKVQEAYGILKIVCVNANVSVSGERIYDSP